MASTSSSASPKVNVCNYDVFISFRGEDTRPSFTDHLHRRLVEAGIRTFRDEDEIEEGKKLKPELESAIKASTGSIVVISSHYATSTWCLDELWLILEQRERGHFIFPVFYHVEPSDVRKQENTFNIQVEPASTRWTNDNVNRWKAALTEVTELKGYVLSGSSSEADFIAKIVGKIDRKLDKKPVSIPPHLTGMDTRAEGINSWLKNEQSGDDVLAVCGMGGSGKTTLARHIYDANKQKFENGSFLSEIGMHFKQPDGLLGLQRQLLKDIFRGTNVTISNVFEGEVKIVEALQKKRVLIVLDDIDEQDELHQLLGKRQFRTKSKIIITTRFKEIEGWLASISWRCQMHEIELLNEHESLELLSCYAFGTRIPMDGFKELAVQFTKYCAGSPLALKVLGSSDLYVSTEDPRERNEIIETWKSALNSLTSRQGGIDSNVREVLRRSFNTLPLDSHKELFLHIACFFVGEYEDYVVKILEREWHAKSGIRTLIYRCLLTVSPSKKVMMHQLLQEMGRKIVHEESKVPAQRTRVWHDDDSYRLLLKGNGSETIEGLALDTRKLEEGTNPSPLKTFSLAKMDQLKLLQLKYVELTGSYENFPELTWLCWHGCHLKTIPADLLMSSLVAIDMSYGMLEEFEPPMVLNLLKILNLKGCNNLVSIRNISRLPNLEDLILWDCSSLAYVCKTIGDLKRLALLDLTGCEDLLKALSQDKCLNQRERQIDLHILQPMFSLPQSIKFLFLNGCSLGDNDDVPDFYSGQSISYMNLGNNPFHFLPNNIDLKTLRVLDLTYCYKLKSLLCLPSTLEELYTHWCIELEEITFQSARFRLKRFGYEGCFRLSSIQGLFALVNEAIDEADQRQEVQLVGDMITEHSCFYASQFLCEYGILSRYFPASLGSVEDFEYTSPSSFLSFPVPSCPKKRRIQGLNVTFKYRRLPGNEDEEDILVLFAKISNTTKGLTWIYNPVLVYKPEVGEDVTWYNYWPIGNTLDSGDKVEVSIIVGNGFMVRGCCAGLEYMDGEVEQENYETTRLGVEVIGGDLSAFKLSKEGWYYLCRRDFFKSTTTPDWFNTLFGENSTIQCTELQGRKNYRQSQHLLASDEELATFRGAPWHASDRFTFFPALTQMKLDIPEELKSKLFSQTKYMLELPLLSPLQIYGGLSFFPNQSPIKVGLPLGLKNSEFSSLPDFITIPLLAQEQLEENYEVGVHTEVPEDEDDDSVMFCIPFIRCLRCLIQH